MTAGQASWGERPIMRQSFLATLAGAILPGAMLLGGCAYHPTPEEQIQIVDSPADVMACRRLAEVSGIVPTGPHFAPPLEAMVAQTVALGGTDLLLARSSRDWSYVRGVAYRCPYTGAPPLVVRSRTVVRVKG